MSRTRFPVQLSFAAFEQDICLAYTRKHLLRGGPVELACNMVDSYDGATKFEADPGLALLRKSILSLSVTFFGSQHHQEHITNKGYQQYSEVLRQLNYHLTLPERQLTDETLLTALSCMLLEIFLPTGPTNFLKHLRGIDAIMQLRGPPRDSAGTTATIFRGLRILSIIGALAESRPSMFSKKKWKRALPVQITEAGMLQHQVFDVLADCTQLIGQRNALLAAGAASEEYELLLAEVYAILGNLEAIKLRWEVFNRSRLANAKSLSKMAMELGIADQFSATGYMLYNTVYIYILQIKDSLCPLPETVALRNAAAMKIAKCLELKQYEQRKSATQSNTIAFVATKVAWQALGEFNSPGGQRLAKAVQSSMNGIFQQPRTSYQKQSSTISPTPDETVFAQNVAAIPIVTPGSAGNRLQEPHPLERQLDAIDIGQGQTLQPTLESARLQESSLMTFASL